MISSQVNILRQEILTLEEKLATLQNEQAELDKVTTGLQKANQRLETVTANYIAEIRGFANAPSQVGQIFGVVYVLLHSESQTVPTWAATKAELGNAADFLNRVRTLNCEEVTQYQYQAILSLAKVNEKEVKMISLVADLFLGWIRAIQGVLDTPIFQAKRSIKEKQQQLTAIANQ